MVKLYIKGSPPPRWTALCRFRLARVELVWLRDTLVRMVGEGGRGATGILVFGIQLRVSKM